jgi:hypothetical protein
MFFYLLLSTLLSTGGISAEVDKDALGKLTAKIGKTFWSAPDKRLVRATTYTKPPGNRAKPTSKEALRCSTSVLRSNCGPISSSWISTTMRGKSLSRNCPSTDQITLFAYAMQYIS